MRRGRRPPGAQGARSNDKIPEPADHAIGWSRGGLSSKVHPLADAGIRPVAPLLDALALAGHRPVHLLADKACSHPSTRHQLRRRLIRNAIPERSDQVKRREDKGSAGGRLSKFDAELYKQRNIVERGFSRFKQWRGIATRYDKYARTYAGRVLLAATIILARP
jgi:putative transposase